MFSAVNIGLIKRGILGNVAFRYMRVCFYRLFVWVQIGDKDFRMAQIVGCNQTNLRKINPNHSTPSGYREKFMD
nr:hypothetical transcript [Hymenolepis microstoma]